jgi:hypothetical protein
LVRCPFFNERDYFRLADHPSGTLRCSFSELNERIVLLATLENGDS